ncbi:MAG: ferritin family protein [Candidatus Aquicultor sp.]|nr:ferritin family protein [Candidatus Aquicultor sp.]
MMLVEQAYCDALRIAFEFEHNGEVFYRQLVDKVTDPFAKKVLVFLADEEVEHTRKIVAFNDHLLGNGDFDIATECRLDLTDRIQKLVEDRMKNTEKGVEPLADDIDIYDIALTMETRSYELYEKALEEADDERVETFFRFMVAEEQQHYDLLANSKKYLTDPAYYFAEYGGWIFG